MELADYVGRLYDVNAFQGPKPVGDTLLTQSLFGAADENGTVIVGIQKLAQRFLLELLTIKGSIPFKPERGSSFILAVRQGFIRTDVDVFATFAFALTDVKTNLARDVAVSDPLDEQLQDARILRIIRSATYLILYIELTSRAGTSRQVILPTNIAL